MRTISCLDGPRRPAGPVPGDPLPIAGRDGSVGRVIAGQRGVLFGAAALILVGCSQEPGASTPTEQTPITTAATEVATTTAVTTTTTPAPSTTRPRTHTRPKDARDESCVVAVETGDSLSVIASRTEGVTFEELLDENRIAAEWVIHPGDELDVCIGNDVDDVTGASRLPPTANAVRRQQRALNELFAPYMIADLVVDGESGPLTRQLLCAARMGLHLPVSASNMSAGGPEEKAMFSAAGLKIPEGAAVWATRWILIDKTCQVMFLGEGDDRIVNVLPTSTGEAGYETRDVQAVSAFRYDPALENGGWHDSSHFPVAVDNPLNGNMYKPLYFNRGQAIHGANYVPPSPQSKGCARLFPWHHDTLVSWLGLDDVTEAMWRPGEIGVTVTVQGDYRPVD